MSPLDSLYNDLGDMAIVMGGFPLDSLSNDQGEVALVKGGSLYILVRMTKVVVVLRRLPYTRLARRPLTVASQ